MTQPAARKKLIEVSIPLEAINKASKKQKAPKGYPTSLHKYWAPRPLAACRAVLFAQLVDDPSSWPDRFPDAVSVEQERARLHKLIERIVPWEASNDEEILQEARYEIARSAAWDLGEEPPPANDRAAVLRYLQEKAPPVYDPFSGGGSIPLEAQRLGLRAYGSDLNPVAVLIGKALVEIPSHFADLPPVNPVSHKSLASGGWRGAAGLAADVRYYGTWLCNKAEQQIGHLYPQAELPTGGEANVIAWLWARTVRSPNPAARGAMVPLVSSFMLSTKDGRKAWAEILPDAAAKDGWRFVVRSGPLTKMDEREISEGTKAGRAAFRCALTGAAINGAYIDGEAQAGRLSVRLMSIVAEGVRGRIYLGPSAEHELVAYSASDWIAGNLDVIDLPNQECRGTFASNAQGRRYCFNVFADYFTARQLVALSSFSGLISEARAKVSEDALAAGFSRDDTTLHALGRGDIAYADAIATYLAFVVDRAADYGSSISTWLTDDNAVRGTFGRQAIQMTWDFCEANFFGDSSAALKTIIKTIANCIEHQRPSSAGFISQIDAAEGTLAVQDCIISTDPPYYNNIGYADLSDFFYVWLRSSLKDIWPDQFRRLTTPKDAELIANPYRHGGKDEAEVFFMGGMSKAFIAMRDGCRKSTPLIIYYAFKQSEVGEAGTTSAGWASFLQALVEAGLTIGGTWPLRTESAGRMVGRDANALASSIVLVCRKRPDNAPMTTRAEFVRTLRRELPDAVSAIRRAGVGPVDMQQSVIGPGMGVFTRHAQVLEDDDSPMPVRTALSLINRVWDEIENEATEMLDPPSQVALAWFAAYGFDVRPAGDLITLANAKNLPAAALFAAGVFHDGRGKAALTPRDQLPLDWAPDSTKATAWSCVQHAIRMLNAPGGGAAVAAALVAAMGSLAEPARALTYRLFQIATEKGWAAEALAYNALAEEWPRLLDLAPAPRQAPAVQAEMFGV